jgi:ubiquinone/menaquinone biosynthesis C-methylase UbiE
MQQNRCETPAVHPLCSSVEFQQAPAEATGLPDSSVDLVTTAQALHWWGSYAVGPHICCGIIELLCSGDDSAT